MKKLVILLSLLVSISVISAQGTYLGVKNASAGCTGCHSPIIAMWETTNHATAHDLISSNNDYGYDCLGCHNTGWDLNVTNGGADEFVEQNASQTPDYVITDQEKWDLIKNVQCEQCHGPVGNDQGSLNMAHMTRETDFSAEVCGTCHQQAKQPYYEEWSQSAHSESNIEFFTRESNGSCYRCHYAQDFIGYISDSEYDGTTFTPQIMDNVITCATCHDPHGTENPGNIRDLPVEFDGKVVCDVCHGLNTDVVDITETPHYTTSEAFDGSPSFGYQYPGETYTNSFHSNLEDRCITCHVHMEPFDGTITITGHTFEASQDACKQCHGNFNLPEGSFDYRGTQSDVEALMTTLANKLAAASTADSATQEFLQANYNYNSVEAEGSRGIHNTKLVKKLLEDAIAKFDPTGITAEDGMPKEYFLSQNYPNPFNPSTTIRFALPKSEEVKLIIYDAVGEKVADLINEDMAAGNYNVTWTASNIASGIYFYRLSAGDFVQTNKMILLK